eukprot:Rmarinus@m.15293
MSRIAWGELDDADSQDGDSFLDAATPESFRNLQNQLRLTKQALVREQEAHQEVQLELEMCLKKLRLSQRAARQAQERQPTTLDSEKDRGGAETREELRKVKSLLKATKTRLEHQLLALEADLREAREQLQAEKDAHHKAESEVKKLRLQLKADKTRSDKDNRAVERIRELEEDLHVLEAELREQKSLAEKERTFSRKQSQDLRVEREKVSELTRQLNETQSNMSGRSTENEKLQGELSTTKAQLQKVVQQCYALKNLADSQLNDLKSYAQTLRDELTSVHEMLGSEQESNAELMSVCGQLQSSLDLAKQEIERRNSMLSRSQGDHDRVDDLMKQVDRLRDENRKLMDDLVEARANKRAADHDLHVKDSQLQSAQTQLKELQEKRAAANPALPYEKKIEQLESDLKGLYQNLQKEKQINQRLQAEIRANGGNPASVIGHGGGGAVPGSGSVSPSGSPGAPGGMANGSPGSSAAQARAGTRPANGRAAASSPHLNPSSSRHGASSRGAQSSANLRAAYASRAGRSMGDGSGKSIVL